jgi:hypothetical protein
MLDGKCKQPYRELGLAQLDLGDGGEQRLFGEGLGADLQARSVHTYRVIATNGVIGLVQVS